MKFPEYQKEITYRDLEIAKLWFDVLRKELNQGQFCINYLLENYATYFRITEQIDSARILLVEMFEEEPEWEDFFQRD